MELLKYTQNIQEVYEALNLIYNGTFNEDYVGAYRLLKANTLTPELLPKEVLNFISECAKITTKIQEQIGNADYYPTATDYVGRIRTDIKAKELYGYSSGYEVLDDINYKIDKM